nr:uncharacterized protein LOC9267728 isoform X2 [Oryza sativa Japonica Group]
MPRVSRHLVSIRPSIRTFGSERFSPHSPFPHPCYSQIPNPHPKILATSAPKILAAAEQAASATATMLTSQPASVVAFSPYLPSTLCHFVIVEPAVPLPSLGATVLRHLPVEPTATVVFSWSQWSALPPTISSTAISSLLVAAACRLLHTSPIGILLLRLALLWSLYSVPNWLHGDTNEKNKVLIQAGR